MVRDPLICNLIEYGPMIEEVRIIIEVITESNSFLVICAKMV